MNIQGPSIPTISTIYSQPQQLQTPVSEESTDLKHSSLKPIEQIAQSNQTNLEIQRLQQEIARKEQQAENQLDLQEQEQIQKLSARDQEVRNHERAHAMAGGQYAGAPRYQYQRGPDGVNYAVAGEVSISTGPVAGDPQMTIEKAQIIKRAALAPAEPSAQDRKVAAEAVRMESQARVELAAMQQQERVAAQEETNMSKTSDNNASTHNTVGATESMHKSDATAFDDPIDVMNQTQEDAFNEINNELTAQLVALGGASQQPQSLGSIVSRFV